MKIESMTLLALACSVGALVPAGAATAVAPHPDRASVATVAGQADGVDPSADVLSWHGPESHAVLPVGSSKLPGAPSGFRTYVRDQLTDTWNGYLHHRPACKKSPMITVRTLRTDGFAFGDVSTRPQPGCQTGGGYEAFWAIRKGEWKQVIGTQDIPRCTRLEKLDFPSSVADTQCYDGTNAVDYVHD